MADANHTLGVLLGAPDTMTIGLPVAFLAVEDEALGTEGTPGGPEVPVGAKVPVNETAVVGTATREVGAAVFVEPMMGSVRVAVMVAVKPGGRSNPAAAAHA
jgi:hypothetical protein